MTPTDWQERLAPWIGSAVHVVTKEGRTVQGRLKSLMHGVAVETTPGEWTELLDFDQVAAVWVQLALDEEGEG